MENNTMNYEASISCYNNAYAIFEFHADSAALAIDHINHIMSDRKMLSTFEWDKFPGHIHYISYKKKGNKFHKYIYNSERLTEERHKEVQIKELIKIYFEYDKLKEERDDLKKERELLIEALNKIKDLFPDNPRLPISFQVLEIVNKTLYDIQK